MKRVLLALLSISSVFLTGCLETTQEITINEDGSGNFVYTSDMSAAMALIKNMGMANNEKIPQSPIDTTINMAGKADSIKGLDEAEKALLKKGALSFKFNMNDEKCLTTFAVPVSSMDDIKKASGLTAKVAGEVLKTQMPGDMGGMGAMGGGDMPAPSSPDDYFKLEFSKGEISRKIDKEKYAALANDEMLNGMKQATAMGVPVTSTLVLNLPRPAEKVEGKNVKLSDDKKKVTVTSSLDDLFDNPESMEFKIKY